MSVLKDVYCLGCKGRHESVEIEGVKQLRVRNSLRHQAFGICPEGKKWTKLLKTSEIPEDIEIILESVKESEEPPTEVKVVEPMAIFSEVHEKETPQEEEEVSEEVAEIKIEEKVASDEPLAVSVEKYEDVVDDPISNIYEEVAEEEEEEEEEEDEEEGEALILNHVRPRAPRISEEVRPVYRNPPVARKNPQAQEKAYSIGWQLGSSMAEVSGMGFVERSSEALSQTRIPTEYHQEFHEGYLEGGVDYLDSQASNSAVESPLQTSENNLKPTTVAGIAGVGIFGAWLASRFRGLP